MQSVVGHRAVDRTAVRDLVCKIYSAEEHLIGAVESSGPGPSK